jgi:hypothetical protein
MDGRAECIEEILLNIFSLESLKEGDHSEDVGINEMILLKYIVGL